MREGGKKYIVHPLPWISSLIQLFYKPSPDLTFLLLFPLWEFAVTLLGPACPAHPLALQISSPEALALPCWIWGYNSVIRWIALVISPGLLGCTSGSWWQLQWFGDGNGGRGLVQTILKGILITWKRSHLILDVLMSPFSITVWVETIIFMPSIFLKGLAIQFHWNIVKKQLCSDPVFIWSSEGTEMLITSFFLTWCFLLIARMN